MRDSNSSTLFSFASPLHVCPFPSVVDLPPPKTMYHIGQDWRKKNMATALENSLTVHKAMRDAFIVQVARSVVLHDQPLAKNMPHNQAFQRKMACWDYNQHGLYRGDLTRVPRVDRNYGMTGVQGTREWVPWINVHQFTMTIQLKSHKILMHRVHMRGYGTDPHLTKGKWTHRWNKVLQRDYLQLNRA
jgi:hypothetical protein